MRARELTLWMLCLWLGAAAPAGSEVTVVTTSYKASTMAELSKALQLLAGQTTEYRRLHHQAVLINILASINLTNPLSVPSSVTIRGVLSAGRRPVLDCGEQTFPAFQITADGVEVSNLEIARCFDTGIAVVPLSVGNMYVFNNLRLRENSALSHRGGGIAFASYGMPPVAIISNCEFVNNRVDTNSGAPPGRASALSAFRGDFTLTNCSFHGHVRNLDGAPAPVVQFYAVAPSFMDDYGYTDVDDANFTLLVDGLTFFNNSSTYKGALFHITQSKEAPSSKCSVTIRHSALFNNNGTSSVIYVTNPSASQAGLTPGALGCSVYLESTRLSDNSLVTSEANPVSVILLYQQSTVRLDNVTMAGNSNVFAFIALYNSDASALHDCNFTGNSVHAAGLFLFLHTLASVTVDGCAFDGNHLLSPAANLEPTGGSAICVAFLLSSLVVTNSMFTNNAGGALGGAVHIMATVNKLHFTDCLFLNNTALMGGGALLYQGSTTNNYRKAGAFFTRCEFQANSALYGGAVVLSITQLIVFQECSFAGNVAGSGGAVVISDNTVSQEFTDCTFTLNRADIPEAATDQQLLLEAACGAGGGGALCSRVSGASQGTDIVHVTLRGCSLAGNTATFGGAVFVGVGTSCTAAQRLLNTSTCSPLARPLDLLYCELNGNTASGGAGGAVYLASQGILNVMCNETQRGWVEEMAPPGAVLGAPLWYNVTDTEIVDYNVDLTVTEFIPSDVSRKQLPCRSWEGNTVSSNAYGHLIATPPVNVTLSSPLTPSSILSPDLIPVFMRVADWYNQTVTSTSAAVIAVASLPAGGMSAISSDVEVTSQLGLVSMANLKLQATPGLHTVTIVVSQSGLSAAVLATFELDIRVKPCPANYIASDDNNQCNECRAGLYGVNSSRPCQLCPANAICSDPNIGGGVVVPQPGWWNSHPLSAEMHPCDNVVACTATNRTQKLAAVQRQYLNAVQTRYVNASYFVDVNNTLVELLLNRYQKELCSDAYQGGGVLCGECSTGLGHVAVVTCKQCSPRKIVIFVHVTLSLVTLLFVVLTIRSSLATSRWHRPDDIPAPLSAHASSPTNPLARRPGSGRALTLRASHRHKISYARHRNSMQPALEEWPVPPDSPHSSGPTFSPHSSGRLFDTQLSNRDGDIETPRHAAARHMAAAVPQDPGSPRHGRPPAQLGVVHRVNGAPGDSLEGLSAGKEVKGTPAAGTHPPFGSTPSASPPSGGKCGAGSAHAVDAAATRVGNSWPGPVGAAPEVQGEQEQEEEEVGKQDKEEEEEEEPQHMTIILILVSYLQVLAMPRRVPLLWPSLLIHLLDVVSLATSAAGSLAPFECFVLQGQRIAQILQISMLQILEPVAILAVIAAFWLSRAGYKQAMHEMKIPMSWYMKPRLILSVCVIILYVYPGVTDVIIGSFACQSVDSAAGMQQISDLGYDVLPGSEGTFWREELNTLCYQGPHLIQLWVIGVPGLVLFAIGVPASCMYFLWRHRHALQDSHFEALWGFLYEEFKPESFYWEVMGETRKLLIITIVSLVSNTHPGIQLQLSLGVLVAAFAAQVMVKPYKVEAMNRLETLALTSLILTFYLLTFFVINQIHSPTMRTTLAVLITVINASTVLYLLYCLAVEVVKEVKMSRHLQRPVTASFVGLLSRSATSMHSVVQAMPCCTGSFESPLDSLRSTSPPTSWRWFRNMSQGDSARMTGSDQASWARRGSAGSQLGRTGGTVRVSHDRAQSGALAGLPGSGAIELVLAPPDVPAAHGGGDLVRGGSKGGPPVVGAQQGGASTIRGSGVDGDAR